MRLFLTLVLALAIDGPSVAAQPRPAEWQLRKVFAVGTEPDTSTLARVRSIQLLTDGRLLVVDAQAKSILAFDSAGRAKPALGRLGSGPAEYRSPYALAVLGDTIAVLDPGNARIGLFGRDGGWRGSWVVMPITGGSTVRLYRVPGKEFYALGTRRLENRSVMTFIRHDVRGPRDTLAPAPAAQPSSAGVMCNGTDKGIHFFSTTFQSSHLRAPGPGGTILDADMDTYRIEQRSAAGAVVRTFAGSAARVPITDVEWDSAGAELAAFLKKDPKAECNRRALERPASKPAIRAFWWDDSGRLWVERYAAKGFAFDVFNDRGVLIASMPAPERLSDIEPSVVGNRVAILSATSDGVQFVQVFRFGVK
jgi:hypothetical protein